MKKFLILIPILFTIFITSSCKSYSIPYDKTLESSTINTGLYIDSIPPVEVKFNGFAKYLIHGSAVESAFNSNNLKDIMFEEIKKNGSKISSKVNITVKDNTEKDIILTKVENHEKLDTKQCEYIFKDIPSKLGKDFIMTISIKRWGFFEKSFSCCVFIDCVVSIIDMKNSKKIWQEHLRSEASFPVFSMGYSDAKDPKTVSSLLRDCSIGIIQNISTEINRKG